MPDHLKFNPYIHEGYRPLASLAGCIKSLAYFHNETINILTHGTLLSAVFEHKKIIMCKWQAAHFCLAVHVP